ncbi:methyltransferase domain-containing protein [Rhodopirellula sp. SWK7]|uniref:methyltransferase domain-containing protein n=1 Tax=Rhodopirellula sp. SWK7 TaxID=595460 RepID=UPI0005C73054|nr:methyltransferase domain-containing protein [Rhodopirellula sp. SWK7]
MANNKISDPSGYRFEDNRAAHTHAYLWRPVTNILSSKNCDKVFELGCGNGAFAFELAAQGYKVTGVDPSNEGIAHANSQLKQSSKRPLLQLGSAYDDLASTYGQFPIVVSLEVVEHVYFPRKYAKCVHDLLEPGGTAIITTPYHGYAKNLALAVSGKLDSHFTALWDHGHIKFWSVKTLKTLFAEQGLRCQKVHRVGRMATFAKSMILEFQK